METPLVNQKYLLEKFPGKGGWTYAAIPEVLQDKHSHFGWVKVKGKIDNYEFKSYNLMPMGNGSLFFAVKAEIRKKIGKSAGDYVHIILYPDNDPIGIPEELRHCLMDNKNDYETFLSYSESEQKQFIEWINSTKNEETKIDRIAKTLIKISNHKKFAEK
jgi:hypothetical protein